MSASWITPINLGEALDLLALHGQALKPLAGGTDLMVEGQLRPDAETAYLNLAVLGELSGIEVQAGGIRIGALSTMSMISQHPLVQARFPLLARSAALTGAPAIQNRATLGGNIINASPAADNPPVLLAYGASIELLSGRGSRLLDYADFHSGYKSLRKLPDELLAAVILPYPAAGAQQYYRKVGTRQAQAISKVALAAVMSLHQGEIHDPRFAFASVGPMPMRALHLERYLRHRPVAGLREAELRAALAEDIHPLDDIRSTAAYRLQVAGNLVLEAIGSVNEEEQIDDAGSC